MFLICRLTLIGSAESVSKRCRLQTGFRCRLRPKLSHRLIRERINPYPLESAIGSAMIYLVDSVTHRLNNWGQTVINERNLWNPSLVTCRFMLRNRDI